jgi:L-aminopeptidase/D-esterase-like protein
VKEISIQDIEGFKIGQVQNDEAVTGCTVIICESGAVCGVDVRGGSPGTRDTDALNPVNNREKVHAVVISGGSSFGLDAAGGVMKFLEEQKIGRDVQVTVVPNVCAAVIFDLKLGRYDIRPDEKMGYAACENAFSGQAWRSGNYGAGTGATIGKICGVGRAMKGGIGAFAFQHGDLRVGAVVAVNCVGDVFDSRAFRILAGARSADGKSFVDSEVVFLEKHNKMKDLFSGNTVVGCIITNAGLTKAQAAKLASHGHNGIARAVRPAHTIFDGDTVFSMCLGEIETTLDAAGILASKAVEYAIVDAVKNADTIGNLISLKDLEQSMNK